MHQLQAKFRIIHPFHPRSGEQFDLVRYRRSWGQRESVDGQGVDGEPITVPLAWTDAGPGDPFTAIAKGRCWFRVDDLLRLAALIDGIKR